MRRFASSLFGGKEEGAEQITGMGRPSSGAVVNLESHKARRRRSGRNPGELEAELAKLRQKLEEVQEALQREYVFSRRAGGKSNQGLVKALEKRGESIRHKMRQLSEELETHSLSTAAERPRRSRCRPAAVRPVKSHAEARGTDRSLARAARAALKKGRFANASERAVFDKIASDLTDGGAELQLHALERIGELKSRAAIPIFAVGASHHQEDVRVAAIRGALAMRDPSTRSILTGALADRSHRVRVWAVRGLYGLDDPSLAEILCGQLRDRHPSVRRTAATYLSWKRIPGAERHLVRRLHDDSPEVRTAVVAALGQCGSDACVFKLIQTLKDELQQVREAAASALEHLLGARPEFSVEAEPQQRGQQIEQLKLWWRKERVKRLIGEATAEPDAEGAGLDEPPAAGDEPEVAERSLDDLDATPITEGAGAESDGLEAEPDGLDAEPDLGDDLDEVGEFVTAEEPAGAKE
ncbi:HEAT repeat domain-containing protein [Myxococcota bacterium]